MIAAVCPKTLVPTRLIRTRHNGRGGDGERHHVGAEGGTLRTTTASDRLPGQVRTMARNTGNVPSGNPPRVARSPKVERFRTLIRGGSHEDITVYR
jgi:hypothetical protein